MPRSSAYAPLDAEATIHVTSTSAPKSIRLKLVPEGTRASVKVVGAKLESVEGRFVNLTGINSEAVRVEASW